MKRIIINADDFGLSPGVCTGILELFESNSISSTSLMIAAPNAVATISRYTPSQLLGRAGVHLQLTGGRPLSPTFEVRSLVNAKTGNFKKPEEISLINQEEVENEWRRQIETAIDAIGGLPTHLDSHHGVHRNLDIFPVYKALAVEYGIPMRGAVSGPIREIIEREKLCATVALVRDWTGQWLDSDALLEKIEYISSQHDGNEVIEVISHPGHCDDNLKEVSSFSEVRENDYLALNELGKNNYWIQNNFRLITFRDFYNEFK